MSYCLNPHCKNPQNIDHNKFCIHCGKMILLDNRYRPISFLGGGGQGRNYLAIDEKTPSKKRCVIKQFCPHPNIANNPNTLQKATELFNREATILDQLGDQSTQIPRLLAHLEQQGFLYLVQEFIDGQNLLQELNQKGSFSELEINDFLHEILPLLKFIHNKKVIHRDIKPENIMRRNTLTPNLSSSGRGENGESLVLIDFGLSKDLSQTVMVMGTIGGTMGYAPQEQLVYGEAYFASDLYALGATCIHLLTGIPPHQLYNPMQKRWLWQDILSQRGIQVSNNLTEILDKMLKIDVSDRFQSVDEVLNVLDSVQTVVVPISKKHKPNIINRIVNNILGSYPSLECIQTIKEVYNQENSKNHSRNGFSFRNLEFHPDGNSLATSYYSSHEIKLWNWKIGILINTYNDKDYHTFTFHPHGEIIGIFDYWNATFNFLKTYTSQEIKQVNIGYYLDDGFISPLAISPNGQFVVTVTYITCPITDNHLFHFDGIKVIDLTSVKTEYGLQNIKYKLGNHYYLPSCLSFTPDSQILASSGRDGLINLWDLKTGNLMKTMKDSQWNLELLKDSLDYKSKNYKKFTSSIKSISFNPHGNILASGGWDNLIKFWNPKTGQLIKTLSGHKDAINSLVFSPDGQLLASGSNDNTVKIWDVQTGEILYNLTEHTGYVNCVAFSPDGQVLASASNDGTIKFWQLN